MPALRHGLRQRGGGRWPADMMAAPAFFGPLSVCMVLGSWPPLAVEVGMLALIVMVIGWAAKAPAGLLAVGASVVSLNGFRENGLGVLSLHPRVDVPVTVTLLCAWALAWAAGESAGRRAGGRRGHS